MSTLTRTRRDALTLRKKLSAALIAGGVLVACAPPPAPAAAPTATPAMSARPPLATPTATDALFPSEPPPEDATLEFTTDFRKHSVPFSEIRSGGPPKDGIPAIDAPNFQTVQAADTWLDDREPVVFVQVGQDARAYPIQILMWHEIVNDVVGGEPLLVTFCPLCNTAIAFRRTFNGRVLDFGTTGRLRHSNLIMYDRQSESWWQQATGEAIVGELTGGQLAFHPAAMIAWADFKRAYPQGQVLSRDTGHARSYGKNPYAGYDDISKPPFLFDGTTPDLLPPMARVLTVDLNGEAVAYPYTVLSKLKVVNDMVGGVPVVIFWIPGASSALDAGDISKGREVGSAVAHARSLDGQMLEFAWEEDEIRDLQTNSRWSMMGQATSGTLAGRTLAPVVAINHFWFSWAAFKPDTRIYQP